jgi:large subunit ribosomal protein L10
MQTKAHKQKIVEDLKDKLARQNAIFFVDVKGVKVKEVATLKKNLRLANAHFQVVKKTLFGVALKESGIELNPKMLPGQIAVTFSFGDEVMSAKEIYKFGRVTPALQIIGGYAEGRLLSRDEVIAFAQLPSKQELFAKAVGSIAAPLSNFINVLEWNIKGLLNVLAKAKT